MSNKPADQPTEYDVEFAKPMRELRCLHCRRLLAQEYIFTGRIAIKCWGSNCQMLNRFIFKDYRNAKIKVAPETGV